MSVSHPWTFRPGTRARAWACLALAATVFALPAAAAADEAPNRLVFSAKHAPKIFSLGSATYLGVQLTNLSPELRQHYGSTADAGVLVARVDEDSPAAEAGLQVGDVLTHVDGQEVTSGGDVGARIRSLEAGDRVSLNLLRDRRALEFEATVTESDLWPKIASLEALSGLESGVHLLPRVDLEALRNLQIDLPEVTLEYLEGPEMREVFDKLHLELDRPEFRQQLDRMLSEGPGQLRNRIHELEERLAELEAHLEALAEESR